MVAEASLRVVEGLRNLRESPTSNVIANFRGYVAVTAYHTWHSYLRDRNPERALLKRRIFYALTNNLDVGLWKGPHGRMVGGIIDWKGKAEPVDGEWLLKARKNPDLLGVDLLKVELIDLLRAVFAAADAPVGLEELVTLVAKILRVAHTQPTWSIDYADPAPSEPSVPFIDPLESRALRTDLRCLFEEIKREPMEHRVALLLSLKDGGRSSATGLFADTGVATYREIGKALGMSADAFQRIESELPMNDNLISMRLGISPRQVSHCRYSVRRNLHRLLNRIRGGKEP